MELYNSKKNDILFTANKEYIDIMLASIYSLLENGNLDCVRIHIICDGFLIEDYKKIEDIIKLFNGTEVYFYPMENYDITKYNIPSWHGTQISNARLFFGDIIKPHIMNIENLLYLDGDTIIVGDLSDIAKYKNSLYACRDACSKQYYKSLGNLDTYYNSGVIYINVDEWMNRNYQEKIINFLRENRIKLNTPDQDIFNCVIREGINALPISYNIPPQAYFFSDTFSKIYFNNKFRNVGYEEIKEAKLTPKIIHSYGLFSIKPWQSDFNPYYDEYMKYIKRVNPDFASTELNDFKKIVEKFPYFYKFMLLVKTYMPEAIEKSIRTLSLKCQQYNQKETNKES